MTRSTTLPALCFLAAAALATAATAEDKGAPGAATASLAATPTPSVSATVPSAAIGTEIKIDNFSFAPVTMQIAVGTTVTWVNRDDIPHTVVGVDRAFKSKVLDTDEKFSYTFTKAGHYPYFCSLHPKMTGEIVVQ
jgi:plastocyanin